MKSLIFYLIILGGTISQISGHSWLTFPYPQEQYQCRYNPDSLANDSEIWGCRAPIVDNTAGGNEFPIARVNRGDELCVSWASNGHYIDPQRGYISLYLSNYSGNNETEWQNDFFNWELIKNVDYYNYQGIKVRIPDEFPLGRATLQWRWFYCGADKMFVSCSDIEIVESGGYTYGIPEIFNGYIMGQCVNGSSAILPTELVPQQEVCPNQLNNPDNYWETNINGERSIDDFCSIDIDLELGNPHKGVVSVDNIDVKSNCLSGTTPSSPNNKCYIKLSLDLENYVLGKINLTDIFYETDCGDEFLDGVVSVNNQETEECTLENEDTTRCNSENIPQGYCCSDNDCGWFSHCKTYQTKHNNGYWVCQ